MWFAQVEKPWQVFINRVLIDSVLTSPPVQAFYSGMFPDSRSGKAILLVSLMILPHLMIVFLYRLKAQRRIMGMAVNQLRLRSIRYHGFFLMFFPYLSNLLWQGSTNLTNPGILSHDFGLFPPISVYFLQPCMFFHFFGTFLGIQWIPSPRQENLLRKYLSYNEPSRAAVSVADLTMAITRDVPELIHEGFMSVSLTASEGLFEGLRSVATHVLSCVYIYMIIYI